MRRGGDSSAAENNPLRPHGRGTVQEVHRGSPRQRNKPSTQVGYQKCIRNNIIPMLAALRCRG